MLKLDPCPMAGTGVNAWVNTHVLRMLRANYKDATIYKKLIDLAQSCGRDIRADITHSIDTGRLYLGIGKGFGVQKFDSHYHEISSLKDLTEVNPEYQAEILKQNQEVNAHNWPFPKAQGQIETMGILYDLYGRNRICLGYSQYHTTITNLEDDGLKVRFANKRINVGLCQFIVPTPMVGEWAINKTGKRAVRCLSNTCERWYLAIEFDHVPSQDDQIRLHYELAKECELLMLVFSGNKSIHGWYYVYRKPEKESKKLMKKATSLGADPMTWIRCQYVRFPGGVNAKTQQKQEILYYNYAK